MSSLVHLLRISVRYLTVLGLLCTRYIHKRIYNDELDVKTSQQSLSAPVTESSLHATNSSSKLLESRLPRLSEHFEVSESISPLRSINLAVGLSSIFSSACLCH